MSLGSLAILISPDARLPALAHLAMRLTLPEPPLHGFPSPHPVPLACRWVNKATALDHRPPEIMKEPAKSLTEWKMNALLLLLEGQAKVGALISYHRGLSLGSSTVKRERMSQTKV